MKIVKTAQPNPVTVGSDLTYTLVVSNNSLTPATDVTIVDTLPAGFTYFSASGQISATISGNTLTLNLGTLAARRHGHDHHRGRSDGGCRQHDHQHGHGQRATIRTRNARSGLTTRRPS